LKSAKKHLLYQKIIAKNQLLPILTLKIRKKLKKILLPGIISTLPSLNVKLITSPPPPPNHTSTATTVSTSSSMVSSSEIQPQNYEVEYHLHQGEVISFTLSDGRVEIIPGKRIFFNFFRIFRVKIGKS
jgi:hypothetical protein